MEELARLGSRIYPMRYQSLDSLTKERVYWRQLDTGKVGPFQVMAEGCQRQYRRDKPLFLGIRPAKIRK